jgi:aryl-alcohol dehydrogenase-like predicted oxidoreductase
VARLKEIAAGKGATQARLAVAWVLAKKPRIVSVMGARKRTQLAETLGALDVKLTAEEFAAVEAAVPADAVAGTRYDPHQMSVLESEK